MAKLMTMFLVLIAIQACLIIYQDQTAQDTVIWNFITDLSKWTTVDFIVALGVISSGIYLTAITAGSIFGFKTDFLIFAPAIVGFMSIGVVFTNLAGAIYADLAPRVCGTLITCKPVSFLIAITVGPWALFYIWTVCEWWRGKDF